MRRISLKCYFALVFGLLSASITFAQRGGGPPGGGRGGFTPEEIWAKYGGQPNESTIDLNKNPNAAMMLRSRGYSIPPDNIIRKDQFMKEVEVRIRSMGMGGPPGMGMGGPPGMGMGGPPSMTPGSTSTAPSTGGVVMITGSTPAPSAPTPQDSNRMRGGPQMQYDPGMGGGYPSRDSGRKEEVEDPRPVVFRYGKLPKELPSWFAELDTDKDGQVGLYEWRAANKDVASFAKLDLNGDGLITAEEVLSSSGVDASSASVAKDGNPFMKGKSQNNSSGPQGNGPPDRSTGKDKRDRREDKPSENKPEKDKSEKPNPFMKK